MVVDLMTRKNRVRERQSTEARQVYWEKKNKSGNVLTPPPLSRIAKNPKTQLAIPG
jgi:spore germination protein GerM